MLPTKQHKVAKLFIFLFLMLGLSNVSFAEKCKVKFKVYNDRDTKIKITKVIFRGDDRNKWKKGLRNQMILPGNYGQTRRFTLHHFTANTPGYLGVQYKVRINKKWYWNSAPLIYWTCDQSIAEIHVPPPENTSPDWR